MIMYKISFCLLGALVLWVLLLPVLPTSKWVLPVGGFLFFAFVGTYFIWEGFLIVQGFKALLELSGG